LSLINRVVTTMIVLDRACAGSPNACNGKSGC